jgi:hypothetical protein
MLVSLGGGTCMEVFLLPGQKWNAVDFLEIYGQDIGIL